MSVHVRTTVLTDGRISVHGGTFPYKDAIKARGGTWDPTNKMWYLPAGTDTGFLPVLPPLPPMPARTYTIRAAPAGPSKSRELWTAEEWAAYVITHRRRGFIGRCCSKAEAFWDYAQGPTHYRCERHGITKSDYTGD